MAYSPYIVRLEKMGAVNYTEFPTEDEAKAFTVLGVSRGWTWNIYREIQGDA